nr:Gag-Pol polyprotein [Tanacetum cinerariifolium]
MMSEKKVNTKPLDYPDLNQLSKDFETRFVPQTELSAKQAFWSQNSRNSKESNLSSSTTIVEVPKELPKVSMVNSSLKKLKFHLTSFDMVVKERTTATAITEGTWGFEHTKACFRDEIIPFVKALKELFSSFDQFLIDELTEVQNVFNQMEQAVEQHCVEKNKFQDKMKDVLKENERLLEPTINTDIVNIVVNANVNYASLKDTLSKLKGKAVVNEVATLHPIDPELLKIDVAPLAPKLRNNRTAHNDYLKHTQEETATLREIVENERLLNPLNTSLDYAYRSQLINFVQKFLGMVKYGNDHVAKIMGYGDYKIGQGLVRGLPKLKFEKDHLCSACAIGKSKKKSHKPKSEDTNQEKLYLLHMDLCGPMRVESLNGKKYILVIVDDYSRFTWVKCLRSMDEALDFIIKFLKMIQHNGVGKRRNHTLIEAARTMLIYAQALFFYGQSENLEKLQPKADIGIFIGYAPPKKAFRIYNRRTRRIVETIHVDFDEMTKPSSSTPYVPPSRNDWDLLFQPMFNELLNPPPNVDPQALEVIPSIDKVIPPVQAESTGSPSSTTVDQDAPSPS